MGLLSFGLFSTTCLIIDNIIDFNFEFREAVIKLLQGREKKLTQTDRGSGQWYKSAAGSGEGQVKCFKQHLFEGYQNFENSQSHRSALLRSRDYHSTLLY